MIERPERRDLRKKAPGVLQYFAYLMVLVYFTLGAILLFTDLLLPNLPQLQKNIIGGLFLVYGLFRAFMVYTKSKRRDDY